MGIGTVELVDVFRELIFFTQYAWIKLRIEENKKIIDSIRYIDKYLVQLIKSNITYESIIKILIEMSSNIATQRSKFLQWIDFRVRITIQDGRTMVGTFLAFDKHMNVVLADTDEYRITKAKKTGVLKQIKRTLGLVIVRGENIISLTAEAPPSQTFKKTDT